MMGATNETTIDLPLWALIAIGVGALIIVVIVVVCICKCCCRKGGRNNSFPWLDRLGIPHAKEGEPDIATLPRSGVKSTYVVKDSTDVSGNVNSAYSYDDGDNMEATDGFATQPMEDMDEAFKRLGQLGIPRAKIERNPSNVQEQNTTSRKMRPPTTPLPSCLSDSSFSNNSLPSLPTEDFDSDFLPSPPPELMVHTVSKRQQMPECSIQVTDYSNYSKVDK